MTLHDRLRAAILARQERARAATPGPWRHVGRNWIETAVPIDVTEADYGPRDHTGMFVHTNEGQGAWRVEDVAFIAAEDPAFVLRQCARDLAILDRHQRDDCNDPNCPEIVELADAYAISTEEEHRPWLTPRTSCASWSTQPTA